MENKDKLIIGIGRRKKATAVVKMKEGKGEIIINKRTLEQYFPLFYQREEAIKPLIVTDLKDKFDFEIKTEGGGISGQVDAVKLGIARALVKYDPSLTPKLKEYGLLTRDPRMKERKKYGQKGARKKFQWTKR
ncbi:MAG: 30S ribosomal protein S9 [Candidatus Omnitrophica bacterium]|nr:30S ribosomal protein S9 [Candidatus Omnitrophota bacterium]MCM8806974.1 30S ribosomal protein S9 [Candidatus Omnitrophota bacterium]